MPSSTTVSGLPAAATLRRGHWSTSRRHDSLAIAAHILFGKPVPTPIQARGRLFPLILGTLSASAFDAQQFDLEDQRRVRRDHAADPARAVTEVGRDDEGALATDLHRGNAFVPARDDLASADRKL